MSGRCPNGDRLLHPYGPHRPVHVQVDRLAIDFGHDAVGRLLWCGGWYSVIGLTTSPALVTIPILYVRPLSAFGW